MAGPIEAPRDEFPRVWSIDYYPRNRFSILFFSLTHSILSVLSVCLFFSLHCPSLSFLYLRSFPELISVEVSSTSQEPTSHSQRWSIPTKLGSATLVIRTIMIRERVKTMSCLIFAGFWFFSFSVSFFLLLLLRTIPSPSSISLPTSLCLLLLTSKGVFAARTRDSAKLRGKGVGKLRRRDRSRCSRSSFLLALLEMRISGLFVFSAALSSYALTTAWEPKRERRTKKDDASGSHDFNDNAPPTTSLMRVIRDKIDICDGVRPWVTSLKWLS